MISGKTLYILLIGWSAFLLGVGVYLLGGEWCACEMREKCRRVVLRFLDFACVFERIRKSYLLEIGKISFGLERCKWNRTFGFSNLSSTYL